MSNILADASVMLQLRPLLLEEAHGPVPVPPVPRLLAWLSAQSMSPKGPVGVTPSGPRRKPVAPVIRRLFSVISISSPGAALLVICTNRSQSTKSDPGVHVLH